MLEEQTSLLFLNLNVRPSTTCIKVPHPWTNPLSTAMLVARVRGVGRELMYERRAITGPRRAEPFAPSSRGAARLESADARADCYAELWRVLCAQG